MGEDERTSVLVFRDGHEVRFLAEDTDSAGDFLRIEHVWSRPGRMAGPHWHPVLTESFTLTQGSVLFRVDGREIAPRPGDTVTIRPGAVHEFRNVGQALTLHHEVRPPLRHREMFELWHRLDVAGRTSRSGVPRNPLALALLWERQDGYLAGVPAVVQRLLLGGLATIARLTGYEARWTRS
ncbi:Mannose-6-phosphate isomerase, cupin superfamily [Amycolatopsis marina]|uniref:Mannose-6-phosphate isomerase, cupin superfamily n=1 Tax=Amycolatopsis marina TaxID=490629 RepID=A0A1I0VCT6_9PSEU|nr:cupin domain-containing protein [Amycolatopsis marina]SFA74141.1 Mannose-6-phosphate isomerase, cupin superfamily [Amycolatopsis marina]